MYITLTWVFQVPTIERVPSPPLTMGPFAFVKIDYDQVENDKGMIIARYDHGRARWFPTDSAQWQRAKKGYTTITITDQSPA